MKQEGSLEQAEVVGAKTSRRGWGMCRLGIVTTMTIAEILGNEELRCDEFPVAGRKAFLAHAAVCALPRRVSEVMAHTALGGSLDDQEEVFPVSIFADVRAKAAKLLNADPGEIALVGPTSVALSYVAGGLKFYKGDNVVVYMDDYPSNVYPWMALADRGVEVRFVNAKQLGRLRLPEILGLVDDDTRLVALASCHFVSGWRLDVPKVGKALRDRGVLFCVDGIQTLGAFPTSVEYVDFLAADAHKWLLGPTGSGILYVRRAAQKVLNPVVWGWHNVRCPDFVTQEDLTFREDARRYEAGSANLVGVAGLRAALDLLLEVGVEEIGKELLRKRAKLVPALLEKGYQVLCAEAPPESASGIVTFFRPEADMSLVHKKLAEAGVVTSLRTDRKGTRYIRVSPHFYNTDAELDRLLALV